MTIAIIRIGQVRAKIGRGTSWIYDKMGRGEFPRPVRLGTDDRAKAVGWIESEIDEWIEQRIAERDGLKSPLGRL